MKIAVATLGVCLVRAVSVLPLSSFVSLALTLGCPLAFRAAACGPDPRLSPLPPRSSFSPRNSPRWRKNLDRHRHQPSGRPRIIHGRWPPALFRRQGDNGPDWPRPRLQRPHSHSSYNDAGRGALIGRVGDADVAQPFLISTRKDVVSPSPANCLRNQSGHQHTGTGSYNVKVAVYAADHFGAPRSRSLVQSIPH